jgi:cell division septation protein DedD
VGIVFGLGSAALIGATGLGSSTLPPLAVPTTPAPTTPSPTPTATATPDAEETPDPDPTLTIPNTQISPGERFTLEGAFPALDKGEKLQVQVKDSGEGWDEFPVTTTTGDGGTYSTQVYTSRTGKRDFRMAHEGSKTNTPAVSVTIG